MSSSVQSATRSPSAWPLGSGLVEEGKKVKGGTQLAEWDPYSVPILAEQEGVVSFHDFGSTWPSGEDAPATPKPDAGPGTQ